MNPLLIAALVEIASTLAPPLIKLVAAAISGMVAEIERMNTPPTAAGVVAEIIAGVNASEAFKEFTDEQKRVEIRRGVSQYITNNGGTPNDAGVDTLIALAVQAKGIPV